MSTTGTAPDAAFWRGKRVLLTGHTGFKGAWLALWLHRLGARVSALALAPATRPNLFDAAGIGALVESRIGDIRDAQAVAAAVAQAQPQLVLHLAAQPLVRAAYREPVETFATNVVGTARLLQSLRDVDGLRAVVVVTTDKVYRNADDGATRPFREDDALGGHDPYSASKAACELVAASWRESWFNERGVALATARAGNVIGGGDWSEDRLIPDAVRAWQRGEPLHVRRPRAVRPWQHVLEPLAAYLRLAERLCSDPAAAAAFNVGPDGAASVGELIALAADAWGGAQWIAGDGSDGPHEAGWLALDATRARELLGIVPRWPLDDAVRRTLHWYRRFADGADARALCHADIDDFEGA